jgi:hypothetical protein
LERYKHENIFPLEPLEVANAKKIQPKLEKGMMNDER